MENKRRPWVWLGALAIIMGWAPWASAQDKGEPVSFPTVDGVTLNGNYYAGRNGNAATVLMLHPVGDSSKKQGWVELAQKLQAEGFAVLTFDFRGHGSSKEVDPAVFWNTPFNKANNLTNSGKESIDIKSFNPAYYTALVNDIAAAKAFLDVKNDEKECNTAKFIVIGAETGATLGALWMHQEWYRCRLKQFMGVAKPDTGRPEGADTICGVWLSISPTLGRSYRINLSALLAKPGKEKAVPMLFLHGNEDKDAQKLAKSLEKSLVTYKGKDEQGQPKRDEKYRYTAAVGLGTKLKGVGLLQKGLATDKNIADYLKEVAESRGKGRTSRDFVNTAFVWTLPPRIMPAKLGGEQLMMFSSYQQFLPR